MNNKKQRKSIIDNASKIRLLTGTAFEKCIIVKDLTTQQRKTNKERREKQKKGDQKHKHSHQMDTSNLAYSEDTICPVNSVTNEGTCMATIENISTANIGNINNQNDLLSFSQYCSQPLLSDMPQPIKFLDTSMLTNTDIGEETIIGGLNVGASHGNAEHNEQSSK